MPDTRTLRDRLAEALRAYAGIDTPWEGSHLQDYWLRKADRFLAALPSVGLGRPPILATPSPEEVERG